eukprot:14866448-Ditylum_brightwellii.AAC.2
MVQLAQKAVELYAVVTRVTMGQARLDDGKNTCYIIEFQWDKFVKWALAGIEGMLTIVITKVESLSNI